MKLELHKSQKRSERFEKKLVSCEWTPDESDVFLFRVCLFKVDFHCHVSFTGVRK